MRSEPIHLAIIGLGHIGAYHIKAVQQTKRLNLIAVCDKLDKYKPIIPSGVEYYTDYKQLLKNKNVDTVVVATPNTTHFAISIDVLSTGKHLIVEKPAVTNLNDFNHLKETALKNNCSIYYALHAARALDVTWTDHLLNNTTIRKELGPLTGFSANFYDPYVKNGILEPTAEALQNCWVDSGINALSVLERFLDVDKFHIDNISPALNNKRCPEILQCNVQYRFSITGNDQNGFGVIDTNWTNGRNHKSTKLFFGESRNMLLMEHSKQKVYRSFPNGRYLELADLTYGRKRLHNHYLEVFKDFLRFKQNNGTDPKTNNKEAYSVHRQLFKAQTALKQYKVYS